MKTDGWFCHPMILFAPPGKKRLLSIFASVLMAFMMPQIPLFAETVSVPSKNTHESLENSFLIHLQYGWPQHYFSDKLYENHHQAILGVSYENRCNLLPFLRHTRLSESLLFEFRLARIWGHDIELSEDQVSRQEWEEAQSRGENPTTDWDHIQVGLTPYYRLYYPLSRDLRIYGEFGLGFTWMHEPLIEDGTQWNFLLSGGFGLDWTTRNYPLFAFIRFEHFSNGGKVWNGNGFTDKKVIGPETLAFGFGIRFPLNSRSH
jgi:hypothetical protein